MAFKSLTSHVPEYLSSQFIRQEERSGRTTRSSEMLNIPLVKTVSGLLLQNSQYLELRG